MMLIYGGESTVTTSFAGRASFGSVWHEIRRSYLACRAAESGRSQLEAVWTLV